MSSNTYNNIYKKEQDYVFHKILKKNKPVCCSVKPSLLTFYLNLSLVLRTWTQDYYCRFILNIFPGDFSWRFFLKIFSDEFFWRFFLKIFPEDFSWRLSLKNYPEDFCWRFFLEIFLFLKIFLNFLWTFPADFWWRIFLKIIFDLAQGFTLELEFCARAKSFKKKGTKHILFFWLKHL